MLATLALILLATAVVPPLGAYAVNRSRVRAATRVVSNLAEVLRADQSRLVEMARDGDAACGSGRMPLARLPGARQWVTAPRANFARGNSDPTPLAADPWGNCYLVNLAEAMANDKAVWVLSAGPDGIVDTPFSSQLARPVGDDVGIRVR